MAKKFSCFCAAKELRDHGFFQTLETQSLTRTNTDKRNRCLINFGAPFTKQAVLKANMASNEQCLSMRQKDRRPRSISEPIPGSSRVPTGKSRDLSLEYSICMPKTTPAAKWSSNESSNSAGVQSNWRIKRPKTAPY